MQDGAALPRWDGVGPCQATPPRGPAGRQVRRPAHSAETCLLIAGMAYPSGSLDCSLRGGRIPLGGLACGRRRRDGLVWTEPTLSSAAQKDARAFHFRVAPAMRADWVRLTAQQQVLDMILIENRVCPRHVSGGQRLVQLSERLGPLGLNVVVRVVGSRDEKPAKWSHPNQRARVACEHCGMPCDLARRVGKSLHGARRGLFPSINGISIRIACEQGQGGRD